MHLLYGLIFPLALSFLKRVKCKIIYRPRTFITVYIPYLSIISHKSDKFYPKCKRNTKQNISKNLLAAAKVYLSLSKLIFHGPVDNSKAEFEDMHLIIKQTVKLSLKNY